jgi:hypothetical protein
VCLEGRKFAVIRLATQSRGAPKRIGNSRRRVCLANRRQRRQSQPRRVSIWRISVKDLDAPCDASAAIFQSEWGSYRKAIDENYFSKPVIRRIAGFARRAGGGG